MRRLIILGALITAAAVPVIAAKPALPAFVTAAVADSTRPAADVQTDVNRKPAETLAFAGVKPGMWSANSFPAAVTIRAC